MNDSQARPCEMDRVCWDNAWLDLKHGPSLSENPNYDVDCTKREWENASHFLSQFSHLTWMQHRHSRKTSAVCFGVTSPCLIHQDGVFILDSWAHHLHLWIWRWRCFCWCSHNKAETDTENGLLNLIFPIVLMKLKHHRTSHREKEYKLNTFHSNCIYEYFVHSWFVCFLACELPTMSVHVSMLVFCHQQHFWLIFFHKMCPHMHSPSWSTWWRKERPVIETGI